MFLHNETILLCGGKNNYQTCIFTQMGRWKEYNYLNEGRIGAAIVSTSTATFIFGGYNSQDTFEYLEKNASVWKLGKTKIPGGFYSGCAVATSHNEIWLIGGDGKFGIPTKDRILSFNVREERFENLPIHLKQGRFGHRCALIPKTRHIIITGGELYLNYLKSTEIINVETKDVFEGARMNSKRYKHGIGVLDIDGQERIVVFGGSFFDGEKLHYLKSVEVYNAKTQKWERTSMALSKGKYQFGFLTIKGQPQRFTQKVTLDSITDNDQDISSKPRLNIFQ